MTEEYLETMTRVRHRVIGFTFLLQACEKEREERGEVVYALGRVNTFQARLQSHYQPEQQPVEPFSCLQQGAQSRVAESMAVPRLPSRAHRQPVSTG